MTSAVVVRRTVLGVDQGYAACGIGLLRQEGQAWVALTLETVRTPAAWPLDRRLHVVWSRLRQLMTSGELPDLLAVEGLARAQEGHRQRGTTSSEAVSVREVTGIVRALGWQYDVPLVEVEPPFWKSCLALPAEAEGPQVIRAVRALVRGCPTVFSEHAADGAGIAMAGARRRRS